MRPGVGSICREVSSLLWGEEEAACPFSGVWKPFTIPSSWIRQEAADVNTEQVNRLLLLMCLCVCMRYGKLKGRSHGMAKLMLRFN